MASYAFFDPKRKQYVLGPPLIPAQENHPPRETWNPTFELAYWAYGLKTAQRWRERLGMKRHREWDRVISRLSPLPVRDGVYLAHEIARRPTRSVKPIIRQCSARSDAPGGSGARPETMRRTLHKVMKEWQWDRRGGGITL